MNSLGLLVSGLLELNPQHWVWLTIVPLLPSPRGPPPLGNTVIQALFFLVVPSGLSQGDIHVTYFQNTWRVVNCSYCYFATYI